MGITHPHVHQINISDGGVPKLPVPEARITVQGVAGDRQRSVQYHGGVDRAVCLYSLEVIGTLQAEGDRKSTRLNSSHSQISYAVFCLKKKKKKNAGTAKTRNISG